MAAAKQRQQSTPRPRRRWGWRIFFTVLLLIMAGLGGLGGWAWWQHGLRHSLSAGQHEPAMAPEAPAAEPLAHEKALPDEQKHALAPPVGEPAEEASRKTSANSVENDIGQEETARKENAGAGNKRHPVSEKTEGHFSSPAQVAQNQHTDAKEEAAETTGEEEEPSPAPSHEMAAKSHAPAGEEPHGEKITAKTGEESQKAAKDEISAHDGGSETGATAKVEEKHQNKEHGTVAEGVLEQEVAVLPPPPLPEKEASARPDALKPAPDPDLVQESDKGLLPVISPDGRQPWRVYARPFRRRGNEPLIAIVIGDMGLSAAATEAVTQQLPGEVTMAFAPYGGELARQIPAARAAGHEVLLQLPMEPFNYPTNDPGPYALLTSLGPAANIDRLEWLLGRFTGYVGVTTYMGEKFTVSPKDMRPVINVLRRRGLMLVDARRNAASIAAVLARDLGVPQAYSNLIIDRHASRIAIDTSLRELERIALRDGVAVGFASAYPVTIDRIANWAPSLELKGIRLAPITAVANQQPLDQ